MKNKAEQGSINPGNCWWIIRFGGSPLLFLLLIRTCLLHVFESGVTMDNGSQRPEFCAAEPAGGHDDEEQQPLERSRTLYQACIQFLVKEEDSPGGGDGGVGIEFFAQSAECHGCPLWSVGAGLKNGSRVLANATYPTVFSLMKASSDDGAENGTLSLGCQGSYHFQENGKYLLDTADCRVTTLQEPDRPWVPILAAIAILLGIKLLWHLLTKKAAPSTTRWILGHFRSSSASTFEVLPSATNPTTSASTPSSPTLPEPQPESVVAAHSGGNEGPRRRRLKSLDVFRGTSIVLMIFVNYGGGGYWFFEHAAWNGLTFADLVFPWFLWIMGVSIALSVRNKVRRAGNRVLPLVDVGRRCLLLFLIGLFLNTADHHNDLRTIRVPGVLQRFALTYLLVGALEVLTVNVSDQQQELFASPRLAWAGDLLETGYQWILAIVCVSVHSAVTFATPLPGGCPTGYVGPGGLHEGGHHPDCTGGVAALIDVAVFGKEHIYQHPTAARVYHTAVPYDPEGLLGVLTSVLLVVSGVQAGKTVKRFKEDTKWAVEVRLFSWALFFGVFAGLLCNFSKESGPIPINKNLWSLSFVMAMSATANLLLLIMYEVIDKTRLWSGSPLYYAGMNPLILYIGHEVLGSYFPFSWVPFSRGHEELLFMDIWGTALWVLASYVLFKKGMFLSL